MAGPNAISDLQAVDFAMGAVLVGAYDGLNDNRPEAFARFLDREPKEKIYRVENEDPPGLLRRITGNKQKGKDRLDLPVIAYYRVRELSAM